MQGKTVLITGATSGIGRAAAHALAELGAHLVLVGRDARKAEAVRREVQATGGHGEVEVLLADLSSQGEVRQLARAFRLKHRQLHVLINNAGGVYQTRRLTADGLEQTFALNHLAPFLLTRELLDLLRATPGARVVNVASSGQAHGRVNFDDLMGERAYHPITAYHQSKLANVLFTQELARRLSGAGVTVNSLHPGLVRSNFGRGTTGALSMLIRAMQRLGGISPEQGAQTVVYLASSPEVAGTTAQYFVRRRSIRSNPRSYDPALARRLWDLSAQLTQIHHEESA